MGALIFAPIVVTLFCIVVFLICIVEFLFSGKSPHRYILETIDDPSRVPPLEVVSWGPVPMIPVMWAAIGGMIWLLIWLAKFSLAVAIYKIIGYTIGGTIALYLLMLFVSVFLPDNPDQMTIRKRQSAPVLFYEYALQPTGRAVRTGVVTPLTVIFQTMAVLKKKVCPQIVVDD